MSRDGPSEDVDASIPLVSPRAQNLPDIDSAVARLEEHIHIAMGSGDPASRKPREHDTYTIPESSYHSSDIVGERHRSISPSFNQWEPSRELEDEEDLGGDYSRSEHDSSTAGILWRRMRIVPKGSSTDPFSDHVGVTRAEYGATHLGKGATSTRHPGEVRFDQHDQLALYSNLLPYQYAPNFSDPNPGVHRPQYNTSHQYPQATSSTTSSYDYDPEGYAMYSTPNKLYSHPRNSLPISRSPTPSGTASRPSLPSAVASGLTRRVLSSKENTPRGSGAYGTKDEEDFEVENHVPATIPSPIVDLNTMHFGLPPRKQRRRHQEGRKLVPLTQCVQRFYFFSQDF